MPTIEQDKRKSNLPTSFLPAGFSEAGLACLEANPNIVCSSPEFFTGDTRTSAAISGFRELAHDYYGKNISQATETAMHHFHAHSGLSMTEATAIMQRNLLAAGNPGANELYDFSLEDIQELCKTGRVFSLSDPEIYSGALEPLKTPLMKLKALTARAYGYEFLEAGSPEIEAAFTEVIQGMDFKDPESVVLAILDLKRKAQKGAEHGNTAMAPA